MSDIELVIKIPEEKYDRLIKQMQLDRNFSACKISLLPKGHGRLIDADALKAECYSIVDPKGIYSELKIIEDYYIDDADTIIEADKESEE